jgi:hypothetical protein
MEELIEINYKKTLNCMNVKQRIIDDINELKKPKKLNLTRLEELYEEAYQLLRVDRDEEFINRLNGIF